MRASLVLPVVWLFSAFVVGCDDSSSEGPNPGDAGDTTDSDDTSTGGGTDTDTEFTDTDDSDAGPTDVTEPPTDGPDGGATDATEPPTDDTDAGLTSTDDTDAGSSDTFTDDTDDVLTDGTHTLPAQEKNGFVILTQTSVVLSVGGSPVSLVASGGVATFGLSVESDVCEITQSGNCQVSVCGSSEEEPDPEPAIYADAGEVSITGLNVPLEFDRFEQVGSYLTEAIPDWLWSGSETATVTVSGSAEVPAFSMDLIVPSPITVTAPLPIDAGYTISKSSDLSFTWTGGVEGTTVLTVTSPDGEGGSYTVTCQADASAGSHTIDSSLLSGLEGEGEVSIAVVTVERGAVDDWMMHFQASTATVASPATFTN